MDWHSRIALDAGQVYVADAPVDARLAFLRKTYGLVLAGLGVCAVGGWLGATYLLPTVLGLFQGGFGGAILFFAIFLGSLFFARAVRATPGLNLFAFGLFTFIAGATLGPLLYIATQMAGGQPTIILQAVIIAGLAITGLSGYVLVTRKDFSFLRGALSIGVFILLGIVLVSWIWGIRSFGAGIAVGIFGVVLFSGFTLYDTSRIVRTHPTNDHVGAALDLFIDFFYLFYYVLYLLMLISGRRD